MATEEGTARRRVAFVGAEYIEYDLEAAPVVRRCGVGGQPRSDADAALEWRARAAGAVDADAMDAAAVRARLQSEYQNEMRAAIQARGFPCLDAAEVPIRVQFLASELLVAWSIVAPDTASSETTLSAQASLDAQRKHMELCRKQVFGPVVDGYAFGRRFFSIDSFLSLLELEELVALAEAHGIDVPPLPAEVVSKIKVNDRELISTYSPTGLGKPLKMLTFRELVEEAYARGILMEDERDAKNKKSKRAWVDALRPVLHAEMRAFKIREAHADVIHSFLVSALDSKMQSTRMETIVGLVTKYLDRQDLAKEETEEMAALHRYFRALIEWHRTQSSIPQDPSPQLSGPSSPPSQSCVPVEPMSPIV